MHYVETKRLAFNIRNKVEGLRYRYSAHTSKHNAILHFIIYLSKKADFHWLRALTWPVYILSYSLAGARLPVNISY